MPQANIYMGLEVVDELVEIVGMGYRLRALGRLGVS